MLLIPSSVSQRFWASLIEARRSSVSSVRVCLSHHSSHTEVSQKVYAVGPAELGEDPVQHP